MECREKKLMDACRERAIMNLFYRYRLRKVGEMISNWSGSDAWKDLDLEECVKHLNAIKDIIARRVGAKNEG